MSDKMKLTKAETVALWHAVNWMAECLKSSHPDNMEEAWQAEVDRLKLAKQALRKVNAIRKAQANPLTLAQPDFY